MRSSLDHPLAMFLALVALYSPIASVSSYFPSVSPLNREAQRRLAIGLFVHVGIFALTALWIGEPLLTLLGLTTSALTVTGGIALMYAGIPLMRGKVEPVPEAGADTGTSWREVIVMPVTFPLTVGGTTFAIFVSFRAQAKDVQEVFALSAAALAYAAVTAITLYISGHLERRISAPARAILQRISGILLTAIAVTLFATGGPRMVVETLNDIQSGK
jgi:multiple antibiotic resistance protein